MPNLATWFSPSLKVMSRSNGTSVVASAAYRACIDLVDERTGLLHSYSNKRGHVHTEFIGPFSNAYDLWNEAEKADNRKNSRCARELLIPLPADFDSAERIVLAKDIGLHLRERYGVAVQISIHDESKDNNKNHHAHIMFTTRVVNNEGVFKEKTRSLDEGRSTKKNEKGEVEILRERVCEIVNTHAQSLKKDWYVYAGKFSDIIEDHIATTHISINHGKNQRKYIDANREEVANAMTVIADTKKRINKIDDEILKLKESAIEQEQKLDYIKMSSDAELAIKQLERAHFAKAEYRLQLAECKKEHAQLTASAPILEYNFFGSLSKKYKRAKIEHDEKVASIAADIVKYTSKIKSVTEYINDDERNRLAALYHSTLEHNAKVDAQRKRERKRELEREIERQRKLEIELELERQRIASEPPFDWFAYVVNAYERDNEREAKTYSRSSDFSM